MDINVDRQSVSQDMPVHIKNPNINMTLVRGERGLPGEAGYTPVKGKDYFTDAEIEEIKQECTYDDTALANRVTTLENTIGTLNDSLEGVLNGGE